MVGVMSASSIHPDKPVSKASFAHQVTAVLVLDDGSVFEGVGFGAATTNVGEVCFNTSMTGYQEIMTDPVTLYHMAILRAFSA